LIIAELMAQMIEAKTDLDVQRKLNLGGSMICHTALTRGEIDLYAEYTGTALTAILKQAVSSDPDQVYQAVKQAYAERFQCEWLMPFGFNNTYTLTVRGEFADSKGVSRISELAPLAAELEAGFTAEFAVREDGYPGLKKTYGFGFGKTRDMDPGLMYKAVAREEVDVICAFATDGRIAAYNLTTLEDDKAFFPPYYAAPVVRSEALAEHPGVRDALAPLAGLLDDATMQKLNLEVDEQKRDPGVVAREFLVAKALIESEKG
jgi:glycine betaine/choline ABC-type transport system substrate-binding protein